VTEAHRILGVEPSASAEQIRAAYLRLVQIYHPDRFVNSSPNIKQEAERRMMTLNAAYHELSGSRGSSEPDMPDWKPIWDRIWARGEDWYQENRRRNAEEAKRRQVHARWEQIERAARERAQAWNPPADEDTAPLGELPSAPTPLRPVRWTASADGTDQPAKDAYATAEELRQTIDVTDTNADSLGRKNG